jgi:dimethylargininase
MFRYAIARTPGDNFADGLTTATLGTPDYSKALKQYQKYLDALAQCGVKVTVLPKDMQHPDSTFVEDVAILTEKFAVLTHPGADSRKGEVEHIRSEIEKHFSTVHIITAPGTLDGGDICDADGHFFIGVSKRTNEEGAKQLADFLTGGGYTAVCVDIRHLRSILHLKSGIAYLGENNLILIDDLVDHPAFKGYNIVRVSPEENYAANCIRVNDAVIMPAGYPKLQASIEGLGYKVVTLEMTEFEKMDGGLSCLSLRF